MAVIQAPLRDPMEIRIFILYLMEHIGRPLTFIEVNDIVIQDGVVQPFDFYLSFPDLIESGHILQSKRDGTEYFEVTDIGRDAVRNFENKLLVSTKELALRNAFLLLNMEKNQEEVHFSDDLLPDGRHRIRVSFHQNHEEILSSSVIVSTAQEAKNIEFEFHRNPGLFRVAFISLLKNNAAGIESYDPLKLQ